MKIAFTHVFQVNRIAYILLTLLIGFNLSCNNTDCNALEKSFSSYQEALETISSSSIKNDVNSTWIASIEFYSCDSNSGFLIINTLKGRSYIHSKVPKRVWDELNDAESKGSYYNNYIKGEYQLRLNQN